MSGTPLGYCVLALLPCFSSFRSPIDVSIRSFRFPEVLLAPPTPLPCFLSGLSWAALGPVHVGIRSQAQVHHHRDGPGLLGAAIFTAISSKDKWRQHSHPNKAVDVFANKTSRGWPPCYQLMLAMRSLLWLPECGCWEWLCVAGVLLALGLLCCFRCRRAIA